MAKNMVNIGDSMRWLRGQSSPANASVEPGTLPVSESTLNPGFDWVERESVCEDIVLAHDELRDEGQRHRLCPPEKLLRNRVERR